jgi:hypothetical protein
MDRIDISILLKNPKNASTRLSMNGKSPMISTAPPFVLTPSTGSGLKAVALRPLEGSKDERKVFQQNHISDPPDEERTPKSAPSPPAI